MSTVYTRILVDFPTSIGIMVSQLEKQYFEQFSALYLIEKNITIFQNEKKRVTFRKFQINIDKSFGQNNFVEIIPHS